MLAPVSLPLSDHPAARRHVAHGRQHHGLFQKRPVAERLLTLRALRQAVLFISGVPVLQPASLPRRLDALGDRVDLAFGHGPDIGGRFVWRVHVPGRLLDQRRNGIGRLIDRAIRQTKEKTLPAVAGGSMSIFAPSKEGGLFTVAE